MTRTEVSCIGMSEFLRQDLYDLRSKLLSEFNGSVCTARVNDDDFYSSKPLLFCDHRDNSPEIFAPILCRNHNRNRHLFSCDIPSFDDCCFYCDWFDTYWLRALKCVPAVGEFFFNLLACSNKSAYFQVLESFPKVTPC